MIRAQSPLASRTGRFSGGKWPPGSNPHAGNSNPLCIGERLKEGVGDGQWLGKRFGIGTRTERADADGGEDRRFGVRVMARMHLHHRPERQSAAMVDDPRHVRPHALASSKRP